MKNILPLKKIGLNSKIATYEQLERLYEHRDCTMFEVFPTNKEIPAGTLDTFEQLKEIFGWVDEDESTMKFSGLEYIIAVPELNRITLRMYTYRMSPEECDIEIDWGDGTIEKVSDAKPIFMNKEGRYRYFDWSHTYDISKKVIVKVYGQDYFLIRNSVNPMISRIFDGDLPVASNLINISSICGNSLKLLKLDIPYEYNIKHIKNISNAFINCQNLQELSIEDGTFTQTFQAISGLFENCINLNCDINQVMHIVKYGGEDRYVTRMLKNCSKVHGTVNPHYFLRNPVFNWMEVNENKEDYNKMVYGCSDEIKAQFPKKFGGTMPNPIQKVLDGQTFDFENGMKDIVKDLLVKLGAEVKND